MKRSTDEWLMSRSCHSATLSIAGMAALRTMRARPVRFSVSTGLRLCGIADEPFCPGEKYSSASSTSVRSEEHTSELQSLMRNSYAVFCLNKQNNNISKLEQLTDTVVHK